MRALETTRNPVVDALLSRSETDGTLRAYGHGEVADLDREPHNRSHARHRCDAGGTTTTVDV